MPALFVWLVNIFSSLVVFFTQYFLTSTAKTLAIITVYVGLVLAFTVAINLLMLSVLSIVPLDGWYKFGASLIPNNSSACVSAYASSHVVRWLYVQRIQYAKFVSDGFGGVKKVR